MKKDITGTEKELEGYTIRDEKRLDMLIEVITAYNHSNPLKSINAGKEAILLAEELGGEQVLKIANSSLCPAYIHVGDYDEAVKIGEKFLAINKQRDHRMGIAKCLMNLGDVYRYKSEYTKGKELLFKSLEIMEEFNSVKDKGRIYNILGGIALVQSEFQESMEYFIKALDIFEELNDQGSIAGILSNIGGIYYFTGDYSKALEQFQKALNINEETGNKMWILSNLGNMAIIFTEMGDYQKALYNFQRSKDLAEELGYKYGIINSLSNIASIHSMQKDFDKALHYSELAIQTSREIGDEINIANNMSVISDIYLKQEKFEEALNHIQTSLEISKRLDVKATVSLGLYSLGNWHFNTPDEVHIKLGFDPKQKFHTALKYILESISISENSDLLKEQEDGLELISSIYEKTGDYKNAFESYKKYIDIRDKVRGEEAKKEVTRKELLYEFDKKESLIKAEQEKKDALAQKELQRQKLLRNSFIGGFSTVLLFAGIFFKQRNKIRKGKKLSDDLLLNILPEEVAEELKAKGKAEAKYFDEVSVMFTDFKGFTNISERLSPEALVNEIDTCFKAFDNIISKYNIEKIKTIGDSYMCAGGLPVANKTNAADVVNASLEIQDYMNDHFRKMKNEGKEVFEIRIGIHTGSVVAGIVGLKKYAYDIWGNTVNIASRMESSGEVGRVNISGDTYKLIKDKFICTYRGKIEAKNKGMVDMYFVEGKAQ